MTTHRFTNGVGYRPSLTPDQISPPRGRKGNTVATTDTERGLYRKYDVQRLNDPDGKHDDCPYFVLDLRHDVHARTALASYADSCGADYPDLATDLRRNLAEGA